MPAPGTHSFYFQPSSSDPAEHIPADNNPKRKKKARKYRPEEFDDQEQVHTASSIDSTQPPTVSPEILSLGKVSDRNRSSEDVDTYGVSPGAAPQSPTYAGQGGFASLLSSPALRHARPVSYGGRSNSGRLSATPGSTYGSPPSVTPHSQLYHDAHTTSRHGHVKATFRSLDRLGTKSVLLIGSQNQLEVSTIGEKSTSLIGSVGDLRGNPVQACIFVPPLTDAYTPEEVFTVVVCYVQEREMPAQTVAPPEICVDLYSLTKSKFVCNLLSIPSTPGALTKAARDLKLDVSGRYLVVSCGASGEVFVYVKDFTGPIRCMTKLWTTSTRKQRRELSISQDIPVNGQSKGEAEPQRPMLTCSGRWLAIVPPGLFSEQCLHAYVNSAIAESAPGLDSQHAPPQPECTCNVESPETDSLVNKAARGAARQAVQSSRWIAEQGMKVWCNYWNRDGAQSQSASDTPVGAAYFPPTHSQPLTRAHLPAVSIYDLDAICRSGKAVPFATFEPPSGCSYLSLSSSGLELLTAGRKGESQYIWDLKQLQYVTASTAEASVRGPRVRQIAKFTRLSPTAITNVIWTPDSTRFALQTRNNTLHVFDLPRGALQWPATRKQARKAPSAPTSPAVAPQADAPTVGIFASAVRIASQAQPIVSSFRSRTASIGAGHVAAANSRALVSGLSRSAGSVATGTMNSIRHMGENRLHMKILPTDVVTIRWSDNGDSSILLLEEKALNRVQVRTASHSPSSVLDVSSATSISLSHHRQSLNNDEQGTFGHWTLPMDNMRNEPKPTYPLSQVEVDTNASHQPFRFDRRVTLSTFDRHENRDDRWVFGEALAITEIEPKLADGAMNEATANDALPVGTIHSTYNDAEESTAQQAVIPTRKKKKKRQDIILEPEPDEGDLVTGGVDMGEYNGRV